MKNLHTFITPMGLLPWILALELDRVPVVNSISCIRQTKAFRVLAISFVEVVSHPNKHQCHPPSPGNK